jgi:hypothetical protein
VALESTAVFLHRPADVDALPIAGSIARPQEAIQVVLQTVDGGVLVKSVKRQPDASFSGEVYGVTPRQRSVAVGDVVRFIESQIFRFKTAENAQMAPADAELAEMMRAFADRFSNADAPDSERSAVAHLKPDDFSIDSFPRATANRSAPAPAARRASIDRAGSLLPADSKRVEPELSVAEAYSMLGAFAPDYRDVQPDRDSTAARDEPVLSDRDNLTARDEPVLDDTSAPHDRPVHEEQPAVADRVSPGQAPMGSDHPVACLECGATLQWVARDPSSPEVPAPSKVSCRSCGRINDIAEAQAASRRRRAFCPS